MKIAAKTMRPQQFAPGDAGFAAFLFQSRLFASAPLRLEVDTEK